VSTSIAIDVSVAKPIVLGPTNTPAEWASWLASSRWQAEASYARVEVVQDVTDLHRDPFAG
jgi:hypothetical protein